jgi:hypothetical protein
LICHTPTVDWDLSVDQQPFSSSLTMKNIKKWCMRDQLLLLTAIPALWQYSVASIEALDLLYWEMRAILYWHTATAIKMASKEGAFFHCCCVSCHHGGHQGNIEQVVAQTQHPEASSVAMDMLHWAMQAALHPRIHMAIKMASKGGTFVPLLQFCNRP